MSIIVLDSTTKSLKVNLSGAVANTNPSFVVTFADTTATAFTEASSDGVLNGTSNVTVVAAPAIATRRVIKNLIIKNNDTAAVTVNLFLDNNGTSRNIARVTLAVDDTWTLSGTFSSNGSLKQTLGTNNLDLTGTTSAQALTVSGATTLSAGTANGILYLNGSKVATSGSALTFDGSKLTVKGGNAGQFVLDNANEQYVQALFQRNATANTGADLLLDGSGNTFNFRNLAANMPFVWHLSASAGAPTEQMRLTSTGLGIGTSSPGYKLEAYRVDLSGARTSPVDIASISAASTYSTEAYTGFGAGLVFKSAYYGSSTPVVSARIRNKINDDSVTSFGSSIAFDVTATRGGSLTQAMELNYAGNLGLGVTPSSWNSGYKAIEFGSGSIYGRANATDIYLTSNSYLGASTFIYKYAGAASYYSQALGGHYWFNAPSGTAGNAITFTQAMTLDASGNLVVGATAQKGRIGSVVSDATTTFSSLNYGMLGLMNSSNTNNNYSWMTFLESNGNYTAAIGSLNEAHTAASSSVVGSLVFATKQSGVGGFPVERARITSGGNLLVGATAASYGMRMRVDGGIASTGSVQFNIDGAAATNFEWVLRLGSGMQFYVNNASVLATLTSSGVWTNASDARYKENIRPVTYGLAEVMQLQPRAYNIIGSEKQEIGFVAQEVEPFIPELVESSSNSVTEEERLTLSYGQMSAVLVKAIQEQQALIAALTARIAALEGTQP